MNEATTEELVEPFLEFLRSFKNAEGLEPSLRRAISVPTGLGDLIVAALKEQRVVLLTGSAGSGKTHLLQAVRAELESTVKVTDDPRAVRGPHVLMIEDATVLSPKERVEAVAQRSSARLGTLVAINEGPLREAAEMPDGEVYAHGVALLHSAKRGSVGKFKHDLPTVIDMAAYDPLEANVVQHLLALPLIEHVILKLAPGHHSIRRRAWRMLKSEQVRKRVAQIVQVARLVQPEWLFRDVWDFVADLALGGSDDDDPPSSAWFWRVFYGDSLLSSAIRLVADPLTFALPIIESRIFHREWSSDHLRLVDGFAVIPYSSSADAFKPDGNTWAKTQFLIMGEKYDLSRHVNTSGQGRLLASVWQSNVPDVLRHINEYIMFGLKDGSTLKLDLWVDHRVERRGKHHEGLIRLGEAPAAAFTIAASQVLANHPSDRAGLTGKDRFLVHTQSGAALALDRARLRTLETARSLRLADRTHADLDWDLHTFFAQALVTDHFKSHVDIYKLDVGAGHASASRYAVSVNPPAIEENG
jgi:energy-coupling factor transporter ATP-binding protein EcfA2